MSKSLEDVFDSKPNLIKAIVAFNEITGNGIPMWVDGDSLNEDIQDGIILTNDLGFGLGDERDPKSGIWMWEGYYRSYHTNTPDCNEWDCEIITNSWRALTEKEWECVQEGRNPFEVKSRTEE